MAQFQQWFNQDFTEDIEIRHCESVMFTGDDQGAVVGVYLFNAGAAYSGGGAVTGAVKRLDGRRVVLTGTLSGNAASVVIPAAALAYAGPIGVHIILTVGSQKTTVLKAIYGVDDTSGAAVDPGELVPDIDDLLAEIETMRQATAAANNAAATVYSGDIAGRMYAQQLGLSDTLDDVTRNAFSASAATDGYCYRVADNEVGPQPSNANLTISGYIPVFPGDVVTLSHVLGSGTFGTAFYNGKMEIVRGVLSNNANKTFTVPANVYWIRPTLATADKANFAVTIKRPSNEQTKTYIDNRIQAKIGDAANGIGMYNASTVASGYYLDGAGELKENSSYALTDYIQIIPESQYLVFRGTVYPTARCGGFYDESKQFITYAASSGITSLSNEPYILTTPVNAKYVRLCFMVSDISQMGLLYIGPALNKFSKEAGLKNTRCSAAGEIVSQSAYNTSDRIIIEPDNKYLIAKGTGYPTSRLGAFFDKDFAFVSPIPSGTSLRDYGPYVVTAPKNAWYMRICYYAENLGEQAVRCLGYDQALDHYADLLDQIHWKSNRHGAAWDENKTNLSLLWCSDLHNDFDAARSILAFYSRFQSLLDDAICTGDVVENGGSDNVLNYWFTIFPNAEKMLLGVGNHDAVDANYSPKTAKQVYDYLIAPNIANWGVTQPTSAAENGLNYWYKDYASSGVRLIMLDCMYWDAAQLSWLQSTLASAKTAELAVICCSHYMPGTVTPFDTTFTTAMYPPEHPMGGVKLDSSAAAAVQAFIDGGGEFICWLSGHLHVDVCGTLADYPDQISITTACAMYRVPNLCDTARRAEADYQSYNLLGIDVPAKVIKLARIGAQYDAYLRYKDTVAINYGTKSIM